ncbi:MAG: hypothetical protein JKY56_08615 [Kofleriaceae bacterium]|nr:hypothetical protein [Kofleriaceae bacterium]
MSNPHQYAPSQASSVAIPQPSSASSPAPRSRRASVSCFVSSSLCTRGDHATVCACCPDALPAIARLALIRTPDGHRTDTGRKPLLFRHLGLASSLL